MDDNAPSAPEPVAEPPATAGNQDEPQMPQNANNDASSAPPADNPPVAEGDQPTPPPPEDPKAAPAEDEGYTPLSTPAIPQFDPSQITADENGLADINSLAQAINQNNVAVAEVVRAQAQAQFEEQRQEEKLWDKAIEKYPELKENSKLRDYVQNARLGEVLGGIQARKDPSQLKLRTPSQVAEELLGQIGAAKSAGMKQATESVQVQRSAHLETATTPRNDNRTEELMGQIRDRNPLVADAAQHELLKSALFPKQE